MTERAVFMASLPAIQSAIKRDGGGNGMHIQLDIPESEMAQAVKMLAWCQCVWRVTIEPQGRDGEDGGFHFSTLED